MIHLQPKTWSNFFFFIPALLSFYFKNYIHGILILLTFIFSFLYHNSNEKRFHNYDTFFALLLIVYNSYLMITNNVSIYAWTITLIPVLIGFYLLFIKHKDGFTWHTLSALITTLVVLSTN